jgi:hypothetical protein
MYFSVVFWFSYNYTSKPCGDLARFRVHINPVTSTCSTRCFTSLLNIWSSLASNLSLPPGHTEYLVVQKKVYCHALPSKLLLTLGSKLSQPPFFFGRINPIPIE